MYEEMKIVDSMRDKRKLCKRPIKIAALCKHEPCSLSLRILSITEFLDNVLQVIKIISIAIELFQEQFATENIHKIEIVNKILR